MRSAWLQMGLIALLAGAGCGREAAPNGLEIPTGSQVSVEKKDGVVVHGRLVDVRPEDVVLERDGQRTSVRRPDIARITYAEARRAEEAPAKPDADIAGGATSGPERSSQRAPGVPTGSRFVAETPAPGRSSAPAWREVTVPAGTSLPVELRTTVDSESSRIEDQVRGTIARSVVVDGVEAIPAGAVMIGSVTEATRSGRVKGRARVAFRFSQLDLPGDSERMTIRTGTIAREAAATKKEDAAKIGGGAAAGAIIGGIIGGGDGAAKGAVIGGGAGTAAVLSTRGDEVTLPAGTDLSVRLTQPVTVRVRRP